MLTKLEISNLKEQNLEQLYNFLNDCKEDKNLLFVLSNLGHLPAEFDGQYLIPYLRHDNSQVRLWTVKNIGKLKDPVYFVPITKTICDDTDSLVKREAVSALGRMRNENAIPLLLSLLQDPDPKVVLQAIRALLVFKHDATITSELKQLINHPNEVIQSVIRKDCFVGSNGNGKNGKSAVTDSHIASPDFMQNVVVHGDVQEVMRHVPNEAIHLTFTSPPYFNARDYSIYPSYQAYLDFMEAVFKEIYRITKEGRFLIVNTSPVIMARVSRQYSSRRYPIPFDLHGYLVKMGWEFIDDIVWIKPETSVKNRNAGFLQHRKPLGYKPNPVTEYVMVYRKQTDKLLDWNMRQYPDEIIEQSKIKGQYETSNAWKIDPTFDKVHSAVFPIELCRRVIQFYSYQGDLVFDPFGGSGTLGKAALNSGRYFFMTEQEEKYIQRMRENLNYQPLFATKPLRFLAIEEFQTLSGEYAK